MCVKNIYLLRLCIYVYISNKYKPLEKLNFIEQFGGYWVFHYFSP